MVASIASNTVQAALTGVQTARGQPPPPGGEPAQSAGVPPGAATAEPPSSPPAADPAPVPEVDSEQLAAAVEELVRSAQSLQRSLQFTVDESSGRTIITVVDKETQEIIRQIPPEEVLGLVEYFKRSGGLLGEIEA
jgi:flagellar protein FlaG